MNPYEEDLQRNLEKGKVPDGEGLEVRAYQEVFRVLDKDPGYKLSDQFAQRVVTSIVSRNRNRDSKDYLWFGAGIFFLAVASLLTILFTGFRFDFGLFTGFRFDFGFLNTMTDYRGLALFGIAFVVFLNWLDKQLVRSRQAQH